MTNMYNNPNASGSSAGQDNESLFSRNAEYTTVVSEASVFGKIAVYLANAVFLLLQIIRNFSFFGLFVFVLVLVYSFYDAVLRPIKETIIPRLPFLYLVDAFALIGIYYSVIGEGINSRYVPYLFEYTTGADWLMYVIGLVFGYFGLKNRKLSWLAGVGGGLLGLLFLWSAFGNYYSSHYIQVRNGSALEIFFLCLVFIWIVTIQLISSFFPNALKSAHWIGIILLGIFIFLMVYGVDAVVWILPKINELVTTADQKLFALWRIILFAFLSFGVAFLIDAADDSSGISNYSVDIFFFILLGALILLSKVLVHVSLKYGLLFLFPMVIGTIQCMKNEFRNQKTCGMNNLLCMCVLWCLILLAIFLILKGFWLNEVIILISLLVIYLEYRSLIKSRFRVVFWPTLLIAIVAEAFAFASKNYRVLRDANVFLSLMLISGLAVLLLFNSTQLLRKQEQRRHGIVVCACALLICLIALIKAMQ